MESYKVENPTIMLDKDFIGTALSLRDRARDNIRYLQGGYKIYYFYEGRILRHLSGQCILELKRPYAILLENTSLPTEQLSKFNWLVNELLSKGTPLNKIEIINKLLEIGKRNN